MVDTARKVTLTQELARIWSNVITQFDKDRDLRDSQKVIKIDALIAEHCLDYFTELDGIIDRSRKLNRLHPTSRDKDTTEYTDEMNRLQARIEELDETYGQQTVTILFADERAFDYCRDYYLNHRGIPADRKQGVKWQTLRDVLNEAEKVEIEEKGHKLKVV